MRVTWCMLLGLVVGLVGCGGHASSGRATRVQGKVVAGVVSGATVRVYRIEADRSLTFLREGTTAPDGTYTLDVPGAGPFYVLAGGGAFTDEATGARRSVGALPARDAVTTVDQALPGVLGAVVGSDDDDSESPSRTVGITPLSTIAARRSIEASKTDAGAWTEAHVRSTSVALARQLGLDADPRAVEPRDFTDASHAEAIAAEPDAPATVLGALLAALSQAAADEGADDPLAYVDALADDYADGAIDARETKPGIASALTTFLDNPAANASGATSGRFAELVVAIARREPVVTEVTPRAGSTLGGARVTLTGSDLADVSSVSFGGVAATDLTVVSETELTVTAPAHAAGAQAIVVATATASFTLPDGFTYAAPPALAAVTPAAGSGAGGARVAITGTGLLGATRVTFGGVDATGLAVVDATRLEVTAPPGVPGACDVTVTSPLGADTLVGAYEYLEPGIIRAFAGDPSGDAADGLPATSGQLLNAFGTTFDAAGNLYVADARGHRIRAVCRATGTYFGIAMTAGNIYTVAGTGQQGLSGDGGPATAAQLRLPCFVRFDDAGNLVISDSNNARIRVVCKTPGTHYGVAMPQANAIYTIAGTTRGPVEGDGGPATDAMLAFPTGLAFDAAGNLFFSDAHNSRIRVLCRTPGTAFGVAMTTPNAVYSVAGTYQGFSGDGGPAAAAQLFVPQGIDFDPAGNLVIADTNNHRVRVVCKTAGTHYGVAMTPDNIYTIAGTTRGPAGDGGPALEAQLFYPFSTAFDPAGNLVIADLYNNRIRTLCRTPGTYYGVAMAQPGAIYTVAGSGTQGDAGDDGPATAAQLHGPCGITFDAIGRMYVSDTLNGHVRVVNP